jgi:phosphoribosylamine--glycine ligase
MEVNVLVVGGGGREHALAWKISQSPKVEKIFCAPGNAGMARIGECVDIAADALDDLVNFALASSIDLTVVGPEGPLVAGVVDLFSKRGLRAFGPTQAAARIEGSKVFAKEFMAQLNIPTPDYKVLASRDEAVTYLKECAYPVVVKADGLAAGKGSIIVQSYDSARDAVDRMMTHLAFGDAGKNIVVEEYVTGEEASILFITDGEAICPLIPSQDHKRILDGDRGPNTGGMGAYAPAPLVTRELLETIGREVAAPVVSALGEAGTPYRGALYVGVMISEGQVQVLEFNCRFGDPETQPVLPLLETDLVEVMISVCEGRLAGTVLEWSPGAGACVVLASGGYPGPARTGFEISGIEEAEAIPGVHVFHAGTSVAEGKLLSAGGRVLGVTGCGETLGEALKRAYEGVGKISFEGMHYREDIGAKGLSRIEGG